MVAKIKNHEDDEDTFEFPYNPQSFNLPIENYSETTPMNYRFIHHQTISNNLNPTKIKLNGHFSGDDRKEQYNHLGRHLSEAKIKRFYFEEDKFYFFIGGKVEKTHQASRTFFIDYVASMNCPIALTFSSTLKEVEYDGSWGTQEENEGGHLTLIEEVEFELEDGTEGDEFIIKDNSNNGVKIRTNQDYSNGDTLKLKMLSLDHIGSGIYSSRIYEAYLNGERQLTSRPDDTEQKILILKRGEDLSEFSISGATTFSTATFKFRDAYIQ